MRRTITALFALALTAGSSSLALAQNNGRAEETAPETSYTFDDHGVEGGRYNPLGDRLVRRLPGRRETLVRPRVHFVPELLKSVERL